jgi:hypothetical protein
MPAVGGGQQYEDGDTIAATGVGTLFVGIYSDTAKPATIDSNGYLNVNVASGGTAGVQYAAGNTAIAATGTGTLALGVNGTTAGYMAIDASGHQQVDILTIPVISATNVTIASIATGTVSVVSMPVISATNVTIASITTGTVSVVSMPVLSAANITVASITTGTISGTVTALAAGTQNVTMVGTNTVTVSNNPLICTAANITVASITTGTISGTVTALPSGTQNVSVVNVLSATGVTIASITTGTVNIAGSVSVSGAIAAPLYSVGDTSMAATGTGMMIIGVQSGATIGRGLALTTSGQALAQVATGTCDVRFITSTVAGGGFFATHHASRWDATVVCTTSGVATVIKASGGHTLYVSDLLISVNLPMTVTWNSATTVKGTVYLATYGGCVVNLKTPMVLNSAQSLTFTLGASGSGAAFAAGWTVT